MIDINDYDLYPTGAVISDTLAKNESLKENIRVYKIILGAIGITLIALILKKFLEDAKKNTEQEK